MTPTDTETALLPVQAAVSRVDRDATPEDIARALGLVEALGQWVKARRAELEAGMVEWIGRNGDLTIGTTRWFLGVESETKCIDPAGAFRVLLEVTDETGLLACLSSGAFKPGECRKTLPPELFARVFRTTAKEVLRDGKPVREKKLRSVDTRFLK